MSSRWKDKKEEELENASLGSESEAFEAGKALLWKLKWQRKKEAKVRGHQTGSFVPTPVRFFVQFARIQTARAVGEEGRQGRARGAGERVIKGREERRKWLEEKVWWWKRKFNCTGRRVQTPEYFIGSRTFMAKRHLAKASRGDSASFGVLHADRFLSFLLLILPPGHKGPNIT